MAHDVLVVEHPAVADRLARIRDRDTPVVQFRQLVQDVGTFLAYEATATLRLTAGSVQTPLQSAPAKRVASRPVVAPILRAGLGLLPGFLACIDDAEVAHLGFYRDPATLEPVPYYANMPHRLDDRDVFVLDPMLATGNSGSAALGLLESRGARSIAFVCLIAAPEGIATLAAAHPNVRIITAAIDEHLNSHGYIVPGLGDAGDRMFGSATSLPISARAAAGLAGD
jgi:uracil phosphoribosyltransferase